MNAWNKEPASLSALGWPATAPTWDEALATHRNCFPARVISQHRNQYIVANDIAHRLPIAMPTAWQRPGHAPDQRATIGDWLLICEQTLQILHVLPRFSLLKRAAVAGANQQQMIAANVNTAFILAGLDAPIQAVSIARYTAFITSAGAQAVVVLTKVDKYQQHSSEYSEVLQTMLPPSCPVLTINTKDKNSCSALHQWLQPKQTVVLLGASGVGKSTLSNTLMGSDVMRTGLVRQSDARGRHTTTHRALWVLPTHTCLIDGPGMRGLRATGEEMLEETFADILALTQQCRFHDCSHQTEPGCALQQALDSGTLHPQRLRGFRLLQAEINAANNTRQRGKSNRTLR